MKNFLRPHRARTLLALLALASASAQPARVPADQPAPRTDANSRRARHRKIISTAEAGTCLQAISHPQSHRPQAGSCLRGLETFAQK